MTQTTNRSPAKPSRRTLIAAAAPAGAAAAITSAAATAAASATPDPIFDMIARHRKAITRIETWCNRGDILEGELPKDKRQSDISRNFQAVEGDDPVWTAHQQVGYILYDAADDIARELVSFDSISTAGLSALIDYSIEFDGRNEWPDICSDDGTESSWHQALLAALAAALHSGEISA
jgi:hypothetical protein